MPDLDETGRNYLQLAINCSNSIVIYDLLPYIKDINGKTACDIYIEYYSLYDENYQLLKNEIGKKMSEQNIELIKAMRTAIMKNDLNTIENLLENNPDLLHAESVFGNWIQEAVREDNYELTEFFIKKGVDINFIGSSLESNAISDASFNGNLEIVKLLYKNGARLETCNSSCNPLFAAIANQKAEVGLYLIDKGIDYKALYQIGSIENCDAMEYASQWGCSEVFERLKNMYKENPYSENKLKSKDELLEILKISKKDNDISNAFHDLFITNPGLAYKEGLKILKKSDVKGWTKVGIFNYIKDENFPEVIQAIMEGGKLSAELFRFVVNYLTEQYNSETFRKMENGKSFLLFLEKEYNGFSTYAKRKWKEVYQVFLNWKL